MELVETYYDMHNTRTICEIKVHVGDHLSHVYTIHKDGAPWGLKRK